MEIAPQSSSATVAERSMTSASSNGRAWLIALLFALPMLSYFGLIASYAENIPFWDDFDSILKFLSKSPPSWHDLAAHHNEHRIIWTRAVAWVCHLATGPIDLRLLMWIGNLTTVALTLLLASRWRAQNLPILFFLPVVYILFQPQSWENMTWAMAALQNCSIWLFAALALACWQFATWRWQVAALAWATVAAGTSGNGIFVPLVLIIWQSVRCLSPAAATTAPERRANYAALLLVLTFTVVITSLYFAGYQRPEHHPGIVEQFKTPVRLVRFLGVLCGAFVSDLGRPFAFVAGLGQLACFGLLTYRRYDHRNPMIYYLLLFCFGSMLAATLTRAGFGVVQATSSRYRVMPLLALALNYMALYELYPLRLSKQRLFVGLMAVLLVAQVASFTKARYRLRIHRAELLARLNAWRESGEGLSYPDPQLADEALRTALDRNVYRLPSDE